MPNFNLLLGDFFCQTSSEVSEKEVILECLGWVTQSNHHSPDFAHGAEPWGSTGRVCALSLPTRSSFSLQGMSELVLGRSLAAFGSRRWRADGKCVRVSRGTDVSCCTQSTCDTDLHRYKARVKLKLKMRKWFREIYVVFYQIIHNWLFFKELAPFGDWFISALIVMIVITGQPLNPAFFILKPLFGRLNKWAVGIKCWSILFYYFYSLPYKLYLHYCRFNNWSRRDNSVGCSSQERWGLKDDGASAEKRC